MGKSVGHSILIPSWAQDGRIEWSSSFTSITVARGENRVATQLFILSRNYSLERIFDKL
jgi:hypothetical protein